MNTLKTVLAASFIAGAAGTVSLPSVAIAHEGGAEIDSLGCHYGRNNRDYHCHEGFLEDMTFRSRADAIRKYNRIKAQQDRDDDDG